jgi:choline kinase
MKIAICYSGQLRNCRMMIQNHINNLYIPLFNNNHKLDFFLYTDNINTSRNIIKNKDWHIDGNIYWQQNNCNVEIFNYFTEKIKLYADYFNFVRCDDNVSYQKNEYQSNLQSQLSKFIKVLEMVNNTTKTYDMIIRLRPDVFWFDKIDLSLFNDKNTIYQNLEMFNNYQGDTLQIFNSHYLNMIILNCKYKINNISRNEIYEQILNNIFQQSGLNLKWIPNTTSRWYSNHTILFPHIDLEYFNDWTSIEYKYPFNIDKVNNLLNIRKQHTNLLINNFDLNPNLQTTENNIYLNALNPEFLKKEILGLIPCSGTASRIGGIPKFLLPCKNGFLIDNTINLFTTNNIDNIRISVSNENEHHINKRNIHNNKVKYIVKNTETMSETVLELISAFPSKKYILIMPDTYFNTNSNGYFKSINQLYMKLFQYDIVVILWQIKEYQYGKLGQIEIDNDYVIKIEDKNPDCRYPYSWGVIGWNENVNNLIDKNTPHIGFLINSALDKKYKIGYIISDTEYFDCGTSSEYFTMIKNYT